MDAGGPWHKSYPGVKAKPTTAPARRPPLGCDGVDAEIDRLGPPLDELLEGELPARAELDEPLLEGAVEGAPMNEVTPGGERVAAELSILGKEPANAMRVEAACEEVLNQVELDEVEEGDGLRTAKPGTEATLRLPGATLRVNESETLATRSSGRVVTEITETVSSIGHFVRPLVPE